MYAKLHACKKSHSTVCCHNRCSALSFQANELQQRFPEKALEATFISCFSMCNITLMFSLCRSSNIDGHLMQSKKAKWVHVSTNEKADIQLLSIYPVKGNLQNYILYITGHQRRMQLMWTYISAIFVDESLAMVMTNSSYYSLRWHPDI